MQIIDLVIGAGILFLGFLLGRFQRPTKIQNNRQVLLCDCNHPYSMHEKETGKCQESIKRPHYSSIGSRNGYEYVKCKCLRYSGPPPLENLLNI